MQDWHRLHLKFDAGERTSSLRFSDFVDVALKVIELGAMKLVFTLFSAFLAIFSCLSC
jgi:hypothetical protein